MNNLGAMRYHGTGQGLGGVTCLGGEPERGQEVANSHYLIFTQVAIACRAERNGFAIDADRPITAMRFVDITKSFEKRTHVMPLNVVIQRVSKNF